MNINEKPLVTVVVATYNSSRYIEETLNSIKAQTYKNIELIISDDYSQDDTLNICKNWLSHNENIFQRCVLIESSENTGTSGNGNRALKESTGAWLKAIGGDDMLLPDAIENYVNYVQLNPQVKHLMAAEIPFNHGDKNYKKNPIRHLEQYYFHNKTSKQQHNILAKIFFGSGPTWFCSMDLLHSVGGFDERFPLQEDYPLFIKLTGLGYKIYYMDIPTVYKRNSPYSITSDKEKYIIYSKHIVRLVSEYKYQYKKEVLNKLWRIGLKYSIWLHMRVINSGNTIKSFKCRYYYTIQRMLDPFSFYLRYTKLKILLYNKLHYFKNDNS